jgi:hypothetical protein
LGERAGSGKGFVAVSKSGRVVLGIGRSLGEGSGSMFLKMKSLQECYQCVEDLYF